MPQPLVVLIPHQLGKQEALSRLQTGLAKVRSSFRAHLTHINETWTNEHLDFRLVALGQQVGGTLDVADDHLRLEVQLPWLLATLAETARGLIQKQAQLMLEEKQHRGPDGPS